MLVEMIAKRKRFFAAQRAEQIRNKLLTRAQLRNKMILKWLKTVEKIEDDAKKEELRDHLDIIPGDDEAINVESLATKYPIVDWKTHALSEDKMYYEIIRGDGSTKFYKIFIEILNDFDSWRLFDSCGVHVLLMDTRIAIHLLIEKTYPLTQEMLSRMLSRRLEVDHECEMAYELLRGGLLGIRGFYDLILLVQVCTAAFIDSRLESIEQFFNRFAEQPNETSINNPELDNGSVDTPLVSLFPHSDNDSDDEEVLNELCEYEIKGTLRRERIINSFKGDDLAFECMIGFRKFTAYLHPILPMNIISRKAYNTIIVDRLEGMGKNLIAIIRDVYVFVGSFTYITDFVMLEDIGEFIMSDMAKVLMGRPFTKIFDTYTYRMPRTIPRLKNFNWSKVPPLLELSQNDLMNGIRCSYEKNKFMYKNCLNLGLEYQLDGSMKEWLLLGHVSIHKTT
ncbi:hypothetical protein Tco_0991041 [Tanacetum coccineum]|uniref:Uncharacterized protein n=1 Tax=Tanacetum coccineum TaxID=301880 RepID=A0ABQ5EZJ0_9ASTR